jgi:uncharacterized protein
MSRPGPVARLLLALVAAYRRGISPLLGPRCRYLPTCSAYAAQALAAHGALRGGWLAARRVARCHPFTAGGVDPVPPRRPTSARMDRRTSPSARPSRPAAVAAARGELPC